MARRRPPPLPRRSRQNISQAAALIERHSNSRGAPFARGIGTPCGGGRGVLAGWHRCGHQAAAKLREGVQHRQLCVNALAWWEVGGRERKRKRRDRSGASGGVDLTGLGRLPLAPNHQQGGQLRSRQGQSAGWKRAPHGIAYLACPQARPSGASVARQRRLPWNRCWLPHQRAAWAAVRGWAGSG